VGLADTFERVKSGVFHIVYLDGNDRRLGSGTGFASCGFLITNHHVFICPQNCRVWIRCEADVTPDQGLVLSSTAFRQRLKSGSTGAQMDFAVLDLPELVKQDGVHNFQLTGPRGYRVGQTVAFLGYPFEHNNLTCHQGIISSFFDSPPAKVIQIDGSVNASNSGGPLIDPETACCTRRPWVM
jgi:S1-C subfamily serine protease